MTIQKIGSDLVRPLGVRSIQDPPEGRAGKERAQVEGGPPGRPDRVSISPEGRDLAARREAGEELSGERIEEIRARLERGFYGDAEVAEATARRILARGDLEYPHD